MIVISGPSTVGKSRVIKCLKDKYDMEQVVSYTSRRKREDETEGVSYHFVDEGCIGIVALYNRHRTCRCPF